MAGSVIDQHLVLGLPSNIQIMELTTSGPHQKSHENMESIGEADNTMWFHLLKEEYDQVAGGIGYHPDNREHNFGVKIPSRAAEASMAAWVAVSASCTCSVSHIMADE